jgi:hypothetical protein
VQLPTHYVHLLPCTSLMELLCVPVEGYLKPAIERLRRHNQDRCVWLEEGTVLSSGLFAWPLSLLLPLPPQPVIYPYTAISRKPERRPRNGT